MAERGHDAVGDDRLEIIRHAGERIETDRARGIGGIDVNEIVGAGTRDEGERCFGEVAVRIKQRQSSPAMRSWWIKLSKTVLLPVPVWPTR